MNSFHRSTVAVVAMVDAMAVATVRATVVAVDTVTTNAVAEDTATESAAAVVAAITQTKSGIR